MINHLHNSPRPRLIARTGALLTALAVAGAVLNANAQARLEQNGRVLVQAEHFFANTPNADGDHWHLWPDEDNYPADYPIWIHPNAWGGKAMYMLPDNNGNSHTGATGAANGWDAKPWLDYKVRIETPGTYQLWLRWRGRDGNADSMYAQILELKDGPGGTIADWYNYFGNSGVDFNGQWRGTGVFEVTSASGTAVNTSWSISTAGDYTIRLTFREDGCAVDALCLQLEGMTAPSNTVIPESPLLEPGPFIWSRSPAAGAQAVLPLTSFQVQIRDGASLALSATDPSFLLNGTPLTFTKAKVGQITTLNAPSTGTLPFGSTNELTVTYQDTAAVNYTNSWQFVVSTPTTIPPAFKMAAGQVDTAAPGFIANIHQAVTFDTNTSAIVYNVTFPNTEYRAEGELRGYYTDPATGQPYTNNFDAVGGLWPLSFVWGDGTDPGSSQPETWLNFNIYPMLSGGTDIGNFQYDSTAPDFYGGVDVVFPGYGQRVDLVNTNNIAAEFITYLDLPAGVTRLGVNSDDGFLVTCGKNPRERYDGNKVIVLGRYEGGRGASDTLFDVQVGEAGIYPIRVLWYQGNGGANLEFFSVKPDGTKVLVNNIASGARAGDPSSIRAYRTATIQNGAVVDLLDPAPNATGVATNFTLRVQLGDSPQATVTAGSVHLYLNDAEVAPVTTVSAPRTMLSYTPSPALAEGTTNTARVEFSDSLANSVTQSWTFVMAVTVVGPAQGEVVRKIWGTNLTGTAVTDLTNAGDFTNNVNYNIYGEPTILNAFEQAQFANPVYDNFGEQWVGYLKPTASDWYTFYLGSDDNSELWLSTNHLAANLVRIAVQANYNSFREYLTGRNVYLRRSSPIWLEAGQRYLFEALHKEGTGGDNFSVAWWRTNDPAIVNGSASISGTVLEKFVGADFKTQPQSVTTSKGKPVVLAARILLGLGAPSYQWLKDGTPKPGATAMALAMDPSQVSDSGTYKLRVTMNGVNYDSMEAVVLVIDDSTPPSVVSGVGMNDPVLSTAGGPGYTIAIQCSEMLNAASVAAATITLSDAGNYVMSREVGGPSNNVVLIKVGMALQSAFSVTLSGVTDPAGNPLPATPISCALSAFTPMVLGTPGTDPIDVYGTVAYGLGTDGFLVTANGVDIWGTADAGHFIYTTYAGDFDAKVRVVSLTRANDWSKAGIMAREDLTPGSRNTMILVAPKPLNDLYNMQWRDVANAACGSKADADRLRGVTYPNAWLRLIRQGDMFTSMLSTNGGSEWFIYHQYTFTASMPSQLYVGLATTSHDNVVGDLTTAEYRDFQVGPYVPAITPQLGGVARLADGNIGFNFTAAVGQAYRVLASTNLALPITQWTVINQGTAAASPVTVNDLSATNYPIRFYTIVSP
ncbi:MAG TPA: PA14 domain-containing protein [Verrucomicrobiae bacterium]